MRVVLAKIEGLLRRNPCDDVIRANNTSGD